MRTSLLFVFAAFLLTSCGEYQMLLRSDDTAKKYAAMDSLYEAGKLKKSLKLMEQLVPAYRGKPQAEDLMFKYANTFYMLEDYYLAGYQFDRFETSYPKSDSIEVAAYKSAKSYYQLSPRYSLDQKDTNVALEKLQGYINKYPNSERRLEANALVRELREKLEKKDIEVADQYLDTAESLGTFKPAIGAYDNFITDHPGSKYRKDAFYGRLKAQYLLAINSVPSKVGDRLNVAKKYYDSFAKYYSKSDLNEEAGEILQDIEKRLSKTETAIN
ncbi:MAG: outer membrane protein assembly factor BamD [Flavobacteriaceae bacterium]|nr:outer membrane protein assembly factor BamD [Flavobacteriaceae bacterium]